MTELLPASAGNEKELEILAQVYQAQEQRVPQSQRSIAQAAGMSVGMANAILKRLAAKGFVMMRRVNSRNVHYLVTPAGVDEVAKRSYHYLRRTVNHVVSYKERLRKFCKAQRAAGRTQIILIGPSDLAFLVEWCAEKEGLEFTHVPDTRNYLSRSLPVQPGPVQPGPVQPGPTRSQSPRAGAVQPSPTASLLLSEESAGELLPELQSRDAQAVSLQQLLTQESTS